MDVAKQWSLIFWNEENSVSTLAVSSITVLSVEELKVGTFCKAKFGRKLYDGEIAGLG